MVAQRPEHRIVHGLLRVLIGGRSFEAVGKGGDRLRMRDVRRRLEQKPVDDGEHRGIGADTERERDGNSRAQSRRTNELAERIARVGAEVVESVDHRQHLVAGARTFE
jgi:hypothetical protein